MLESMIRGKEKTRKSKSPETVTVETTIQLLIFKNDGNPCVKIIKIRDINLEKMVQYLNQGESIIITRKPNNEEKAALNVDEEMSEPWYFTHI